jgi:hypothetical protein
VATVRQQLADEQRRQQRPRRRHAATAADALTSLYTYHDTTTAVARQQRASTHTHQDSRTECSVTLQVRTVRDVLHLLVDIRANAFEIRAIRPKYLICC